MAVLIVAAVLLLLLLLWLLLRTEPGAHLPLPPGPRGVPILGYLPFMTPNRYMALARLSQHYGDVMVVPFFTTKCVVLSSLDALQEAFITQSDVFSARPKFRYIDSFIQDTGIVCTDGDKWREHRRFALRTLRDFGFGKVLSAAAIEGELQSMIRKLEAEEGTPLNTMTLFSEMTANVISALVFGDRVASEDAEFAKAKQTLDELIACDSRMFENLPVYFPWLMDVPLFMHVYDRFAVRKRLMLRLVAYIRTKVDERVVSMDAVTEPNDFTEAILLHKMGLEKQGHMGHTFDSRSIAGDVVDLFAAGTDTTAVTLTWGCLLLALHQDIAARATREVLEAIGADRPVTMQDRSRLNFTLAVLDEVSRFSSIAPTALIHRTSSATTLRGFHIPADVPVIANLFAVHTDPRVWTQPDAFFPGHFLDQQGMYKPSPHLVSFSLGKRACLGESLARMELFVFFTSILQRYRLELEDEPGRDLRELLTGTNGLVRHLQKHRISFRRLE